MPAETIVDRLAAPDLPPNPSQADLGEYTYWAHCMACHGDRGQGLTAEFRSLYPEEDRNCWESGCHGPRPYEDGFTLPSVVPPLIGSGLEKFGDAARLQAFVAASMPFSDPGSLSEEQYWQVTAFLLRENGLDPGTRSLGPGNAAEFRFPSPSGTTPAPETATPAAASASPPPTGAPWPLMVLGLLLMVGWWLRVEKQRRDSAKKE